MVDDCKQNVNVRFLVRMMIVAWDYAILVKLSIFYPGVGSSNSCSVCVIVHAKAYFLRQYTLLGTYDSTTTATLA